MRPSTVLLALALAVCASFAQHREEFCNPILAGFYPDPSVCRVGEDYYLVNSTFAYYPGIGVFHSRDLVHWDIIGHVLERPEVLNLEGQGVSRGLFAPSIRFEKGIFYVTCTLVDIGGNFVSTAVRPEGPWSNPLWFPGVDGIDPSLFFDDDGRAFLLYNSVAPGNKPLYEGHRTIRMREFDAAHKILFGEERILVNGGTDISRKPVWIEGPHMLKTDGWYYLLAAEGGTEDQHSEVVFRSRGISGPFVPFAGNPILTQRTLDPKRAHPVTCVGHADLVQTPSGEWWAVFLGCRPYRDGYFNTGRETFLAPVRWIEGWPVINPDVQEVKYHYPSPLPALAPVKRAYGGNFTYRDEMNGPSLDPTWMFLRTPRERWYDLDGKKGFLTVRLRPETCSGTGNPSFLCQRQQHLSGSARTALEFTAKSPNEKAGIAVFQNESHYYYLCESIDNARPVVQLFRSGDTSRGERETVLLASQGLDPSSAGNRITLRIDACGDIYRFFYRPMEGVWAVLKDSVDATFLSTKIAGGFVGCMYALYATSDGQPSGTEAAYDWFEYTGTDDVYR